ncbi:MAG TPA: 2-C-methyl-D-erythritol 4-phosphate cytidylyltransferase, partial [Rhizomicrobium sp.]
MSDRCSGTEVAALIVAGGSGTRAGGGLAKQYRRLGGRPMIRRTIEAFQACPEVDRIQVVIGNGHETDYAGAVSGLALPTPVTGGETRQDSVRRGLQALAAEAPDFVLIHDAARPLVSSAVIGAVIAVLRSGADAVLPFLPVADSLRRIDPAGGSQAISRDGVGRAQTPQGFRFTTITGAHERFAGSNAGDDIALAERAGVPVTTVPGEEANLKVTTEADFALAERLLRGWGETRTGMGFDAHRFVPGDHLWLCGVR